MIDLRAYLEIEQALKKRLIRSWRAEALPTYEGVQSAVLAKEWGKAYDLASRVSLSNVGTQNRDFIQYMLLASANFGALMASPSKTTMMSSGAFGNTLGAVTDTFLLYLTNQGTYQVYKNLVQSIAAAKAAETVQKAEESDRFVKSFVSFSKDGDAALQLVSSLHTSRLATWGFTAEAEVLGVTTYRLTAVLDGRTSDFCRTINGRTFQVEEARRSIVSILGAQTPEETKSLQPWPQQSKDAIAEYRTLSSEELTARGLHIPPFHPRCRTLCARVTSRVQATRRPPESSQVPSPPTPQNPELLVPQTSTAATFESLGLQLSDDAVQHWNTNVGLSPLEVLAKISGSNPAKILEGVLGKTFRGITVAENGDINFLTKKIVGAGKVTTSAVYDPFSNSMYLNYADFKAVSAVEAASSLKQIFGGMLDVGESMGAATFVVTAAGTNTAYSFGKMGFSPTPAAWIDLKTELLDSFIDVEMSDFVTAMGPERMGVITELLGSKQEQALVALVNLPYTYKGSTIGTYLLKNKVMQMSVDFSDKAAITNLKESL